MALVRQIDCLSSERQRRSFCLAAVIVLSLASVADARWWPNGKGDVIQATMLRIRDKDVVIRPHRRFEGKLIVVPHAALRPVDLRYLKRKYGFDKQRLAERQDRIKDIPDWVLDINSIRDAETLLKAATHFRGKTRSEVLEIFRKCLDLERNDNILDGDNLWLLAPVIFEPPATYPDFWRWGKMKDSTWPRGRPSP